MDIKDVVIIGDGIAGCSAALTLAKQGIAVTMIASSCHEYMDYVSFLSKEKLEEMSGQFQDKMDSSLSCPRACEHLSSFGQSSIRALFDADTSISRKKTNIHHDLREQLQSFDRVEWLSHHHLIQFLTLDQHSIKPSDRYKKATCLGVVLYDWRNGETKILFSKETILATGGFSSFFSCSMASSYGMNLVSAQLAGARLLNVDRIPFYPLALYKKNDSCFPLPLALLKEGGKLYQEGNIPLNLDSDSPTFIQDFYDFLIQKGSEYAWLDLSSMDLTSLSEKVPFIEDYCLSRGLTLSKHLLPVAPAVGVSDGGIAVDRTGQTSLHRLRAIGEMACTGLFWKPGEEVFSILESLTWAVTCAEESAKQINRLVYYFPEIKKPLWTFHGNSRDDRHFSLPEDWQLLRRIMWSYLGIRRDRERLERGKALLEQLRQLNTPCSNAPVSIEQLRLFYTIQAAELIAKSNR